MNTETQTVLYDRIHEPKPQASDLTESQENSLPRLSELGEKQQQKAMLHLWERMRGLFGQSWVREHGELDGNQIAVWLDALGVLRLDQIKKGIEQCAGWQERFPPSLPQFARLCTTSAKPTFTDRRVAGQVKQEKFTGMPKDVLEVMQAISKTTTERDESFTHDYNKLCRSRWGSLPRAKR